MMTPKFFWPTAFALLFTPALPCAAQRTIHVPADQPTIQAGIDAASNGDTVLVSPGTYLENINFNGKAITVTSGATSAADSASTVIKGARNGSIVTFQNNEPTSAVLNGFTIRDAFGTEQISSDGIDILGASPTITNNTVSGNIGCGIVLTGTAGPLIKSNTISGNIAPVRGQLESQSCLAGFIPAGVGIAVISAGSVQIIDNLIEDNGGASTTQFENGTSYGIYIADGDQILIESNIIRNNTANIWMQSFNNSFISTKIFLIQNLVYSDDRATQAQLTGSFTTLPTSNPMPTVIATNNTLFNQHLNLQLNFQPSFADNNLFLQTLGPPTDDTFDIALLACGGGSGFNGSFLTAMNNDIYAPNDPGQPLPCPLSTGNIAADAQFLNDTSSDPTTWNFRVQRTSPVLSAGDINAPMVPATDLDGKNRTVCGKIDIGAYEKHPIPPITLTSAPNPSVGGTTVTFQANLQGNCNIPTGTLTFLDGQTNIGTATLDAAGNATFQTASLFVGTHPITASYPGDFNFDPSTSNVVNQVVTGIPTQTSLQVSPNPAQAFQSITFSATVTSNLGVPTGTISFLSGAQVLTTANLNASGTAVANLNTLGAGTYSITAVYTATVDYGASTSAPVTLVVNGATTSATLSSSPNPSTFGQLVTFMAGVTTPQSSVSPTGTVAFREGATPLGSSPLSQSGIATLNLSTLSVGSHTIAADYSGSPNDNPSTTNSVVQVVNPSPTSIALTGSPNPAPVGQTVTLAATVSSSNGTVPTGTVVFSDQFGTIGSASIVAGQASLSTSTLASGTHNILASYVANGGLGGATSNVLVEVIQSFDFSLSLSPSTLSLASGASGTVTLHLQGVGNLPGNVALAASGVPTFGAVAFNPTAISFVAGGSGTAVLSINTAQLPQHALLEGRPLGHLPFLAGLIATPFLFMRRRRYRTLLCLLLTSLSLAALSGCTNISFPLNRVEPGTYSIPITGIDQTSQITHTTTLTLTVTP